MAAPHRVMTFRHTMIGKKVVMVIAGVVLVGFVVAHMLGNLNIDRSRITLKAWLGPTSSRKDRRPRMRRVAVCRFCPNRDIMARIPRPRQGLGAKVRGTVFVREHGSPESFVAVLYASYFSAGGPRVSLERPQRLQVARIEPQYDDSRFGKFVTNRCIVRSRRQNFARLLAISPLIVIGPRRASSCDERHGRL